MNFRKHQRQLRSKLRSLLLIDVDSQFTHQPPKPREVSVPHTNWKSASVIELRQKLRVPPKCNQPYGVKHIGEYYYTFDYAKPKPRVKKSKKIDTTFKVSLSKGTDSVEGRETGTSISKVMKSHLVMDVVLRDRQ